MIIIITTGTYSTSDYRIVKAYKNQKSALKFAKSIGYVNEYLTNDTWTYQGTKYTLTKNII